MNDAVVAVLAQAKQKILLLENWTSIYYARDADHHTINPRSTDAICWCGYGAILAVTRDSKLIDRASEALDNVIGETFSNWQDLLYLNEGRAIAHTKVLAAFDAAIAAEKAN